MDFYAPKNGKGVVLVPSLFLISLLADSTLTVAYSLIKNCVVEFDRTDYTSLPTGASASPALCSLDERGGDEYV